MNLSDLLQRVYADLGQFQVSTATGGTTLSLTDTKQADTQGEDDAWKEGYLFIISDSAGEDAAPTGEYQRISAYDDSAGLFTVDTVFSVSPASGDKYGWANNYYPLFTLIERCNAALKNMGAIPQVDTTTLDSVESKTEYAISVAWKKYPPFALDYQTKVDDSNDNKWEPIPHWRYVPSTAGSTGLIEIKQLPASRDIRVWYKDVHSDLNDFDDVIYEGFPDNLVVAMCVESALRWQNARLGGGDDFLVQLWNEAKDTVLVAERKSKIWQPPTKQPTLTIPQK